MGSNPAICYECRHRVGIFFFKCNVESRDEIVNYVTGKTKHIKRLRSCRDVNSNGECQLFDASPAFRPPGWVKDPRPAPPKPERCSNE